MPDSLQWVKLESGGADLLGTPGSRCSDASGPDGGGWHRVEAEVTQN